MENCLIGYLSEDLIIIDFTDVMAEPLRVEIKELEYP